MGPQIPNALEGFSNGTFEKQTSPRKEHLRYSFCFFSKICIISEIVVSVEVGACLCVRSMMIEIEKVHKLCIQ
jgi:hypothetical protein